MINPDVHRMSHEIRGVFFNALMILNQSFVDRSAPDFFRKPADTDIACGIILNMSCTVGSCHPSSMLISPMPICFDLISKLPFYPSTRVPILQAYVLLYM